MIEGVSLDRDAFGQPGGQAGMVKVHAIGHHTYGGPTVDFLESFENGPQVLLVLIRIAHVVNGKHNHGLDTRLAHPLRCNQPGRVEAHMVWIAELVEIC